MPFKVVAVDGGPGFERDSLLLTVFYNEKDSPMQLAIFGPEAPFGHSILRERVGTEPVLDIGVGRKLQRRSGRGGVLLLAVQGRR